MNVDKWELKDNVIIKDTLFLKGECLYIQAYDPVNGRAQMVFNERKELVAEITSNFFWKLEKVMEKILTPKE